MSSLLDQELGAGLAGCYDSTANDRASPPPLMPLVSDCIHARSGCELVFAGPGVRFSTPVAERSGACCINERVFDFVKVVGRGCLLEFNSSHYLASSNCSPSVCTHLASRHCSPQHVGMIRLPLKAMGLSLLQGAPSHACPVRVAG